MTLLKLIFGSSVKRYEKRVSYSTLSTSRKFVVEFNQEEETLAKLENEILGR